MVRNPTIDRLRITLVDGFCGGGAFDDDGLIVEGTPLLLLRAVEHAEQRLNQGKAKPLRIDAQFHFIDANRKAVDFLRDQLDQKGFAGRIGQDVFIHNKKFEAVAPEIQEIIAKRTAKGVGRSLFLLDQKGYAAAPLSTIQSIFRRFRRAECILTFAVDWLIDYLANRPENILAVTPVGLSPSQVKEYVRLREEGGRYMIQRLLLRHLQQCSGAEFATPFFIRSKEANKTLWLVHLSRHSTARNVMVDSHWSVKNHSIHQGRGGLEINGFDPDWENTPTFLFEDHERKLMMDRLSEDLLRRIRDKYGDDPVVYGTFLDGIVNETPARLADIDSVITYLGTNQELVIRGPAEGAKRSPIPKRGDSIEISRQRPLF